MALPVPPPVSPMLAKLARELPVGEGWCYEPKWDGFRCIVFRDGDDVELGSRNERPLTRYFPEILQPLRDALPDRAVVDGELVIATDHGLDFDLLSNRIHPADEPRADARRADTVVLRRVRPSRARATTICGRHPSPNRRALLDASLEGATSPVRVTPLTTDPAIALDWFARFEGAGLDGVVAKRADEPYLEGKRTMQKVKHLRTADCVVAGYRVHKDGEGVGSLLLGLYDTAGDLHHVGVASSFAAPLRAQLAAELAPLEEDALDGHPWREWGSAEAQTRMPGAGNRWNAKKDMSWVPLRIERVAEVAYEHLQGDRFRHTARFQRWRPDRDPPSCTYEQLDSPVPIELQEVFGV